ncbi:MAG TPA: LysR family transcriptional regulator [Gaiellaceae bacterium]|nr:LysR family transcriptional regulator [Gaiellaceae bacterium]
MEPDRWLGVELRHFAALEALATEGSFGRAAQRLGYTQSAVSQQIATLERIVGERLVERPGGPRPVSLTEAGRLLLRHAESIVARLQAAQADLEALRSGEAGTLRVGTFQSVGARVLPEIMARYAAQWPQIDVMLSELEDDEIAGAVERGDVDVGFVMLPVGDAPLDTVELIRDPYVLVTQARSPIADGRPDLHEIAAQPLVGFRACPSVAHLEGALRVQGIEPRWAFRSNDNPTVQALVAAGMGNAIVPLLTVDTADPRVTVTNLPELPPRVIAIAQHRDRYAPPAVRAFVETAIACCGAGDAVAA